MSKFMMASASLVFLLIQSQYYSSGVRAESATDNTDRLGSGGVKVTAAVEAGTPDWVRSFADSTFYLEEGRVVQIAIPESNVTVAVSGTTVEVKEGSNARVVEQAVFDPEVTSEYTTVANVHDLFLKNYRWSKYDDRTWESYEPVILNTDSGVKQLKVWLFMSEESDLVDKVSIIDQDSNLYSIHLKYERPVE